VKLALKEVNMDPRESSSAQWWEDRLVADYREYRWRQLMEPMCQRMEKWKAGELTSVEIDQAFEECYHHICELRNILNQRSDRAVLLIQVLDREWFEGWIREHTPPPGARLVVTE